MDWKLTEIDGRMPEVVDLARDDGPQMLTQGDDIVAVVLSRSEYERLTDRPIPPLKSKPKKDFLDFLMSGPKLTDEELKLFEREHEFARPVDFGEDPR